MKNLKLRALCECGIFTAAALALSYLKIPIGLEFGGFGGSISLVMIPIVICAIRWGLGWGLGTGLVFGILKFFIGGGSALNWQSMLLDYFVAYMFVGFAGLIARKPKLAWLSALIGCLGRFLVHFVSGITEHGSDERHARHTEQACNLGRGHHRRRRRPEHTQPYRNTKTVVW